MLASPLPTLSPPTNYLLSSTTAHSGTQTSTSNSSRPSNTTSRGRNRTQQPHYPPHPHSLHSLTLEENSIGNRKQAIAKFGYSWIKPAGCSKTMLGRAEEEQERLEQERAMAQAEATWEMEGMELQAQQGDEAEAGDDGGERDLDADVPDADAQAEDGQDQNVPDGGEENSGLQEGRLEEEVGMDSIAESSAQMHNDARTAARGVSFPHQPSAFDTNLPQPDAANGRATAYHLQTPIPQSDTGAEMMLLDADADAEADEVDLDADIPEAGSGLGAFEDEELEDEEGEWQHTDTDASLSSSPSSSSNPVVPPGRSRSMRLVSPSVNVNTGAVAMVAATPPNARTSGGNRSRSGAEWLRNATQRARESFSSTTTPPLSGNVSSTRVMRGGGGAGAGDSSSPMTPGSVNVNANANRTANGRLRLFSGRANPFQRHFSGSASGNAVVSSPATAMAAGEMGQSQVSSSRQGVDSTAVSGSAGTGRVVSSGNAGSGGRRRRLLRREN